MHRIRPYLGLITWSLIGAATGVGSILAWLRILGPHTLPAWAFGLLAGPTALLLMAGVSELHGRYAARHRPHRRAHARPTTKTRRTTA